MDDLNCINFVSKIKAMSKRERSKIQLETLLEIICQVPDTDADVVPASIQFEELRGSIKFITEMATKNNTEIASLKMQNMALKLEVDLLKEHSKECKENRQQPPPPPPPPQQQQQQAQNDRDEIQRLRTEVNELKDEVNSIQQYLRVNNLEVVGLPEPNNGETEETLLLNAFNELEGLDSPIRNEDIDISHPLPSNRKDNKSVHVVRFISRKTKFMILAAKKREENKQFKFRNHDIYINEHLSKYNRSLFAAAQEKKKNLNFKYCWTRGGNVHLRKTDQSDVVTISSHADLENLVQ